MIEKIGKPQYKFASNPCHELLELIKTNKSSGKEIEGDISYVVAEIGVGIGATAVKIMELLSENDQYYMFSFEDDALELKADLKRCGFQCKNIHAMGNSRKKFDSYNWTLAKLYQSSEKKEIFDISYLDGAHSFLFDGLACCLLKKMTKKGGIIVFDDIDWSYAKSPTVNPTANPAILNDCTEEQINTQQIKMVVEIFMKDDPEWELIEEFTSKHRATYKKIK